MANVADVLTTALGGIDRGAPGGVSTDRVQDITLAPQVVSGPTAGAAGITDALQSAPAASTTPDINSLVADALSAPTAQSPLAPSMGSDQVNAAFSEIPHKQGFDGQPTQVDGAKKDFSMTAGQTAGLAAVSTGLQTYAALRNISQQEQTAMSEINQQWKDFEFTNRMNRSMEMLNEAREIFKTIDSLKTQGEQVAAGSQQQTFFRDPITGLRV